VTAVLSYLVLVWFVRVPRFVRCSCVTACIVLGPPLVLLADVLFDLEGFGSMVDQDCSWID
jgi:hypothetical protein